jgi:hypothetical protein
VLITERVFKMFTVVFGEPEKLLPDPNTESPDPNLTKFLKLKLLPKALHPNMDRDADTVARFFLL